MNWVEPYVIQLSAPTGGRFKFVISWRRSVFYLVLWLLYSSQLAFCFIEQHPSCYIGLSDPKPDNKIYAEYVSGLDQKYTIPFPVDLCEDQKDVTSITLSVLRKTEGSASSGIPYLNPIPEMMEIGYSSPAESEDVVHFRFIKQDIAQTAVSYRYTLEIVFPKLTRSSSCVITVEFSSKRQGESYSATSKWTGSLTVQEKAKIERIQLHAVRQIVDQRLHNEIKCGKILGNPEPKVVWSCQGNENFWIRQEKDGEKIPGPHDGVNLSLYEFADDGKCQGKGRNSLTCTATNNLIIDGKPESFSDSIDIDTEEIISAVDNDKASCQDATETEVRESMCKDFLRETGRKLNYNSTHKFQSFKDVLTFQSYHKDGIPSVCGNVTRNLLCSFYGSDCQKRSQELRCRKECLDIVNFCVTHSSITISFCNSLSSGNCDVDFTVGLTLLHNQTQVALTNNSAYIGNMAVAKNKTCQDWDIVDVKPKPLFPSLLKNNYCRAIYAPQINDLFCHTKESQKVEITQCWPEPPSKENDPPSIIHSCDVFCGIKELFSENLVATIGVLVFVAVFVCVLLILVYCCCCKKPSVRLVETDANNFPGIKLRQNPMYNGNSQSRILPNTPDPSFGMGSDVRPNSRFPSVAPASRNRYVPTPENSLGRASGSSGHNFRYPQGAPGPRAHSPGLPPVHASAMNRGGVPTGAAAFGYGSGGRGGADPNPLSKFEYDRNKIQYIEDIGSGAFGYVFRAKAPGLLRGGPMREMPFQGASSEASQSGAGIEIAVKMLKDDATEEQMADFVNEAKLMSLFNHPNIIKLLGVCSVGKPFCLILEYMKNRDLSDFLRRNGPESDVDVKERVNLTTADLILICQQVASGMSYISEKNYIHRDLATRNCLVSESMAVKISDFGLSQYIGTKEYLQVDDNDAIPIRWIAPEALHSNRYTKQSDVWAFGVLLWEVFSYAKQPYYSMQNIDLVVEYVTNGNHLPKPHHTPDDIYDVMCQCWNGEPTKRPTFRNLYEILDNLLKRYTSNTDSFC